MEIVISLAIFSLIIVAVFRTQWEIGDLLTDNFQIVNAINYGNFSLANSINGLEVESAPPREMLKIPFTRCEFKIESRLSWKNNFVGTSSIGLSFLGFDNGVAKKYEKDCGGHPQSFNLNDFNEFEIINLPLPSTSVDIFNDNVAFSLKSNTETDPDFAILNLEYPTEINYLDVGQGVNKIDSIDGFTFAAHNSTTTQLTIISHENGSIPAVVATSTLPGVAGVRPEAISIFYFDSKVYIGTKRTAGHEFHIFDVTNPHDPVWLGSREVNHNINDISVIGGYAFLATSGNIRDIIVLDVRNPQTISQVATVDMPGNEDGRSIFVLGDRIYLGRNKSTSPQGDELHLLAYSLDQNGNLAGIEIIDSAKTQSDVQSITQSGRSIFVTTNHPQKEIQIFEIDKDKKFKSVAEINLPNSASGIDFENETYAITSDNKLHLYKQD